MAKERFTWLAADQFTRSRGKAPATRLEQGATYEAAQFDAAIVEEWVRSGAAEWAGKAKVAKEQ